MKNGIKIFLNEYQCSFDRILIVLICLWHVQVLHGNVDTVRYTNKVLIIIANENVNIVNQVVSSHGLKYEQQVIGRVYEYKLTNAPEISSSPIDANKLQGIISEAPETILNIYQAEEISLPLETREPLKWSPKHFLRRRRSVPEKKLKLFRCSPNYGMHIPDVWSLGYQGRGVVVAIVDAGVEVTHEDLAPNINLRLSYNFVPGQLANEVNPDIMTSYMELDVYSDHGNNCAGLVAAVQDNDICNCGVASHANLAALKMVKLTEPDINNRVLKYSPEWLLKALSHKRDEIQIYSNSHGPSEDFAKSASIMNEVFRYGAENGRNGKGSIYVFAAGNKGSTKKNLNLDGYVNNIYTIAVSSVCVTGSIPDFAQPGAVVLASTYGEGVNKFDNFMVTTSHKNSCTDDFKRTSASAALASGIIALVLQANPDLTWRDMQHLIVITSSLAGLEGHESVTVNGAGLIYHPYFGFGLMDASALVNRAKAWKLIPPQKHIRASTIAKEHARRQKEHTLTVELCICPSHSPNFTEHAVAYVEYYSYYDANVEIKLCSPSKTCSNLLTKQEMSTGLKPVKKERKWNFMSLQFWGENPCGMWKLMMRVNKQNVDLPEKTFNITMFNLTIYGYGDDSDSAKNDIEICEDVKDSPMYDTDKKDDSQEPEGLIDLKTISFVLIGTAIVILLMRNVLDVYISRKKR